MTIDCFTLNVGSIPGACHLLLLLSSLLLLWTKTIMTNNGWKTDNNKETEVRTRYKKGTSLLLLLLLLLLLILSFIAKENGCLNKLHLSSYKLWAYAIAFLWAAKTVYAWHTLADIFLLRANIQYVNGSEFVDQMWLPVAWFFHAYFLLGVGAWAVADQRSISALAVSNTLAHRPTFLRGLLFEG